VECAQSIICFLSNSETDNNMSHHNLINDESTVYSDSDEEISVEQYSRHSDKRNRSWCKDHCCLYCQKYISKLSRHLTDCHGLEGEVKIALSFPVKSAEHREKFEHLMCVGDHYHNISVLESGRRQLIVLRRPTKEESHTTLSWMPRLREKM